MAGSPVIRNDSYRIAIRQQGAIHAQPAAVENGTREGGQMPASAEEPELDMDTPLAELRAAVEIRKHRQTIEASGLYSDEEIPEDLARLRLLTEKVEEAEEKARLLAYLAEADKKSMIRPDPHCKTLFPDIPAAAVASKTWVVKLGMVWIVQFMVFQLPLAVGFPYYYNPTEDPEAIAVYASFAFLLFLPQIIGGFSTLRKLPRCTAAESTSPGFLAVTATLIGTLRDDGFALFAGIATAVLLFIAQEIDHPTPTEIAWIMSSPVVIFVASIDVWFFRFDKAAWERRLPQIQFLRKKQGDGVAEPREWENPDLEDVSLWNGLRAANELISRISSIYYFPLAIFVQVFGAFAFYLPLSDFRGRQSGIEERGADILRITASIYGALSSLVGTFRLLRKPTFKFTVRSENGFRQVTTRELPGGSRERKLLFDLWTLGVDWLASRIDLEIMSDEELAFFERQQIEELQGPVVREEGDHPRRFVGSLVFVQSHLQQLHLRS